MYTVSSMSRRLAVSMILFATGCSSHAINFHAVDADTHQPIRDVDVFTVQISHDMVMDVVGSGKWARTDADGNVKVKLPSNSPIYKVLFDKRGYQRTAAFPKVADHTVRIQSPVTPNDAAGGKTIDESDPVEVSLKKDPTVH